MLVKETSKKLLDSLTACKAEYTPDYKVWQKKEEFKLVGAVKERIREMYTGRQNTCPLTNFTTSQSWDQHWDLLGKNYLMYSKVDSDEDFQPGLKSGMAYRTITQIDAKERKQEIAFLVEARNEDDQAKGTAITHQYLFKDYFRRNNHIRYKFFEASKASKIYGTSIAFIPYNIKMKEVMVPKTPDIDKESIKKGELPKMQYEKKWRVDFEDVDFIKWQLPDFYVDPNAQCLHGSSYVATDCAGILYVTPAQVREMFSGDPDVKNLDKIHAENTETYSSPFYKTPRDYDAGYCELIFYYNRDTDSEVIMCGDVLLKEGPLPYEDKQLPFVAFHCVKIDGQFYGMGITDALLQLSSEDSSMKNARIRNTRLKIEAPIFVGSAIFGDVDNQIDSIEPGAIIKVNDVAQVKVMDTPSIPFDSWRISEELKDEAVMNTGINPQGLTLPMSSTPATNTLAMKESMSDVINMYTDNLMEGMTHWGNLVFSRFCQFYKLPTRKAALELNKKEMRELRLEDIMFYDKEGQMKVEQIKGSQIIKLDAKAFEWKTAPRVYVSPDFVTPISQAHSMRKAQEILPQLAPFAGEPGTEIKPGMNAPIDIRKLLGWYLDKMDIKDKNFLIDEDEDRIDEIKQAQKQQMEMMDGEEVEGIPGEPKAHRYTHAIELMRLNKTTQADGFIQMTEIQEEGVQAFVSAMLDYKEKLTSHLETDNLIEQEASEAATQESRAFDQALQQQQQGMMPGMMPGMEGMMPGQEMMGPQMPMNNQVGVPQMPGGPALPNQGQIPVPNNFAQSDESGMGGY